MNEISNAFLLVFAVRLPVVNPLVPYLGEAGVNVLVRLSAFILVCIGIQIGWSGLSALFAGLQHPVALL